MRQGADEWMHHFLFCFLLFPTLQVVVCEIQRNPPPNKRKTMKGLVLTKSGHATDNFELTEALEKPEPGPNSVLVKVAASALNPVDWCVFPSMTVSAQRRHRERE